MTARGLRIESGAPSAEEVAAVTVALSAVLAARAAGVAGEGSRDVAGARWTPAMTRRRAATSWVAGPRPGWRNAA
ncbi:acyl-CoA carboxylase epsilon subunit [Streptomyces sp. NPDC052396]|uniref:acyl-CoA carboxylase epsilon subunit n=1 Tax=Streptomyces sp. NPDC052396 TaxID=3365689 RepID=UPI0037CF2CDD